MAGPQKNVLHLKPLELIFATANSNKIAEVRAAAGKVVHVISLAEAGIRQEIPEPWDSLEENAAEKAGTIAGLTGKDCFSEDSGLFVTALNGEPGVRSARYAGAHATAADNISLLLQKLKDQAAVPAYFKTVICLVLNKKQHFFTGECAGRIINEKRGSEGFGYDPVFIPDGSEKTFGEMTAAEKEEFSHRKKAVLKLTAFLHGKN